MANRTVSVMLQAEIGNYVANMARASAATKGVGETADGSARKAKAGFDLAGKAGLLMGTAVVAGLGMAISKSMEFEKSMSAVSAATQASASTLGDLRDAAMKAGADTAYSATEAADGITEMAKAGVSAQDIMGGGLTGALSLAAAGQIEVADAAGIASTAMTQFNLTGEDLSHVADLLAAGAGKAMGSVGDLGAALNQSGLIASAAGLSIEETTGGLAAFASAGLIGSDAGTSFKTMLQALQAPSDKSAELMADLGLNMYDANGDMLGLAEMAGQLQTQLSGLTEEQRNSALATIFGSDAVRAANVLYKEGTAGITDWTNKVNDSGYAAETAAALQDNLAGDLEKLGGSFDTLLITIGQGAQGPLRELTQGLGGVLDVVTSAIGAFAGLPGPVQLAVGAFAAFKLADTVGVLGRIHGAASPLRGTFIAFGDALGYARAKGDGLGTVLRSVGDYAGSAATGGLKRFASAIGPELGLAAATYLVIKLADGIKQVATAGDEAAAEIGSIEDAIKSADGNSGAFDATSAGLDDLKKRAADAKAVLDDFENQSWFDKNVWQNPFSDTSDVVDAKKNYEALQTAIGNLDAAQARYTDNVSRLSREYGISKDKVIEFADAHGINLSDSLSKTSWNFDRLASSTGEFDAQLQVVAQSAVSSYTSMETYAAGLGLGEEAAQDLKDRSHELGETLAGFVDPLGVYTGLLDEKKAAEEEAARKVAEATTGSAESWQNFVVDTGFSFDEYMRRLEEQVTAQDNWQVNMLRLAGRVSQGTLEELAKMGPEGAPLVADLVNRSDAELDRFDDITHKRSQEATDAWGEQLTLATPVLAAIGRTAGQGVVDELAAKLRAGTTTVAEIAAQYGVNLAGGINPVLTSLGKPKITYTGTAILANGRVAGFAAGGYTGDGGKFTPAGIVHKGEFVMPQEAVKRIGVGNLGAMAGLPGYANGGFVTAADVPKPPSTAPFGSPISTGADATMQKGFDEVRAWMEANSALSNGTFAGSGRRTPNGAGGLGPAAAAARAAVMGQFGISNIGGYSYRNIAGTGTLSDHATGHAIDVMIANYKSAAGIAQGNSVASYLVNNADKFGTKYVIWRDQINEGRGWNPYHHPGGGSSDTLQHRDHVHGSFFDDGGYARGAGYLPKATVEPERVLSPRQTAAFEQMVSREFSGNSGPATFHLYDSDGTLMGTMRGVAQREAIGALIGTSNVARNGVRL